MSELLTVRLPFTVSLPRLETISPYVLDWAHVVEGAPHLGAYFFDAGEELEIVNGSKLMLHRRKNGVVNEIVMPHRDRIGGLKLRELLR